MKNSIKSETFVMVSEVYGIIASRVLEWKGGAFKAYIGVGLESGQKPGKLILDWISLGDDEGFVSNYVKKAIFNRVYDVSISLDHTEKVEYLREEMSLEGIDVSFIRQITPFYAVCRDAEAIIECFLFNESKGAERVREVVIAKAKTDSLYAAKLVVAKAAPLTIDLSWFSTKQLIGALETRHRDAQIEQELKTDLLNSREFTNDDVDY
jgi:hypothetical protein